jgi:opacity protein-like surface antigen
MSIRSHVPAKAAFAAAAAGLAILGTAPQVAAADQPVPGISVKADQHTKAIAAAHPTAAAAGATVCGTGYALYKADQLPDSRRFATLFVYVKGSNPASNDAPTCAILDNNASGAKWMKIKLCSNYTAEGCASDAGVYSQYAGPVYRNHGGCGTVTSLMSSTTTSSGPLLVNNVQDSTNCN